MHAYNHYYSWKNSDSTSPLLATHMQMYIKAFLPCVLFFCHNFTIKNKSLIPWHLITGGETQLQRSVLSHWLIWQEDQVHSMNRIVENTESHIYGYFFSDNA